MTADVSSVATTALHDNRKAFAEELTALARADSRVVAVCNDSVGSSNLTGFLREFPDRLVNVGIAEQTLIGVGAGLANAGLIPFVCAASPFLTGRALEQIKADVAYSGHGVILCGMSPGLAYGALGPTHHSPEDLSWLRAIPGLDIVVPADRQETRQAVRSAVESPRPMFIRVGRFAVPDVTREHDQLRRGRMSLLRDGNDVTLIGLGTTASRTLEAAKDLARVGISARVLNSAYVAPFDRSAIERAARETRAIITVEEANVAGGLGAAVAEVVLASSDAQRVPVTMLGLREFAPTGDTSFLLDHFGLTPAGIAQAATEALARA